MLKYIFSHSIHLKLRIFSRRQFSKNIAVILSGSGVYDGSEIHEATSCLIHLSRNKAQSSIFAPDIDQFHVIDHRTGKEMNEKRNVLTEAARIARGQINSLDNLKAAEFDGLLIPGGFGVAKNLSDFAFKGSDFQINKQLETCIRQFLELRKPIGVCCIAPVLLSRIVSGVELTMGSEKNEAVSNVKKLGVKHVEKNSNEIHVDTKNLIVSSPAYMCDKASLFQIFNGIGLMVDEIIKMTTNRSK